MLIQHRWQLISGAENIADFSPSVQQINPRWQLENTFSPANESRPLSYFPFFTIVINWWLTLDVFHAVLGGWICLLSMLGCLSTITDQGQGVFDASEQIFHHSPWFPCLCQGEWRLNQNISLLPRFHLTTTRIRRGGSSKKRVWSVRSTLRIPQGGPFCLPSHWHWLTLLSKGGGCYFAQSHTCYRWFLCRCLFFQLNIV